ncbi:MAG: hypothetical protein FJ030_12390 [Chloroflexi bacterium]|nr:hypothetical protein [Chloroflexota bacterium]
MNKVFRHKPLAADEYLGHVGFDGKTYEARFGPDKFVGHVELDTGKIYGTGINNYLGRVQLDTGKVFRHKPAALDEYLGHADGDGKLYRHRVGPDEYIGKIEGATSYALSGAAFMLLVWPLIEEEAETKKEQERLKKADEQEKKEN